MQRAMRKNRFTVDELLGELRVQGVTDLHSVRYAILETNGQLALLLESSAKPPTAESLGLSPESPELPCLLISDGRLLEKELQKAGLDKKWLEKTLRQHGLAHHREVFLLSIDSANQPLLIKKER